MNQDGLFITLEGIEGVGKTTLAKEVIAYLKGIGHKTLLTREPGGTDLAEKIRSILKDPDHVVDASTELLLMFASRSHHVSQVIAPALATGTSVVSDRYVDASYAYQGGGRGIPEETLDYFSEVACQSVSADITILVTCPVNIAMGRVLSRQERIDRIEQERYEFFERVQDAYIARAQRSSHYIMIDGSQDVSKVKSDLLESLTKKLAG
ncbi:dTMP kinase [Candidatus Synchoanobacter obligatus]|uniref:Thymidylate kinase n=1 Tax=Candidatus Synchoanobacter obligatus TaxID=2919597 RepID=A0ABT1L3H3_9GAMM|nr:dTMP kinase [Candidatus Synchoanobacter obligatus]MCP8351767.1 dTMP kinase [Candidatus Synchoanobacter obligatus]